MPCDLKNGKISNLASALKPLQISVFLHISDRVWGHDISDVYKHKTNSKLCQNGNNICASAWDIYSENLMQANQYNESPMQTVLYGQVSRNSMGLLPDTQNCGCACAGNVGNFFPVTPCKRSWHTSRHVRNEISGGGKRSRHSRRMRNLQFYVSGKRSMAFREVSSWWNLHCPDL